jgi:hypothetical protein
MFSYGCMLRPSGCYPHLGPAYHDGLLLQQLEHALAVEPYCDSVRLFQHGVLMVGA